jgi:type IV secretion system protein VirB4
VATLQNRELREALQHYTVSGAMGYLLDAEADSLALSSFQVFEIEHLMNLGDKNALPVLRYIFHRVEAALDGHPAILVIDEAWIALKHPLFKDKITEWLKVLRKANVAVGLATQSLNDLLSSGILEVIAESCPTKIFLANPEASGEFGRQIYQKMGLNERQVQIIAGMAKYRDYYVVSPKGRRRFELGLGSYALRWLSGLDKEPRRKLQKLMNEHPEEWREIWSRGGATC